MSQAATQLLYLLQSHRLRLFTTRDLITLTGMKPSAATQALRRLATRQLLSRVKRGLWANHLVQNLIPYEAVPYLAAPWPAYVSLYSALADYGVIEEIPHLIYAVSSNRSRQYRTPLGAFQMHHLPEQLLWGYQMKRTNQAVYPIAEPEKAFLDLVYLALTPRSTLELPRKRGRRWSLDRAKLRAYSARINFRPMLNYLKRIGL